MNEKKSNFPVDMIEDHHPTEVKAGLASNGRKAQQWRLTFSQDSKEEKRLYKKMNKEQRAKWNEQKQQRIHERKQAAIKEYEKDHPGVKVEPQTITTVINPDTQTADIFVFKGFHDRIDWQSKEAKDAYVGSFKYDHKDD